MKGGLFIGGLAVAVFGTVVPAVLPSLPSSIQTGALSSAGSFVVNNQTWIILAGLIMIFVSIFL